MNVCSQDKPIVSIIVPVYNCEKYISSCLETLLAQSFQSIEIILVDDGSTDKTGAICDSFEKCHPSIRVFHQSNEGQAVARNRGVSASKGEWICFVDGDDMIHPRMIEMLYEMVLKHHVKVSMCEFVEFVDTPNGFDDRKAETQCMDIEEKGLLQLDKNSWCIVAKLIHRSIIEDYPFTEGKIYEDNAVVLEWLYEAGNVAIVGEPWYYYRVNPEGTTKKAFSVKQLDLLWAIEKRMEFCENRNYKRLHSKNLEMYLFCTRNICKLLRETGNKQLAKSTRKQSICFAMHQLPNTKNKLGVILRIIKCCFQ